MLFRSNAVALFFVLAGGLKFSFQIGASQRSDDGGEVCVCAIAANKTKNIIGKISAPGKSTTLTGVKITKNGTEDEETA